MSFIVLSFALFKGANPIVATYLLSWQIHSSLPRSLPVPKTLSVRNSSFLTVHTSALLKAWIKSQIQSGIFGLKQVPNSNCLQSRSFRTLHTTSITNKKALINQAFFKALFSSSTIIKTLNNSSCAIQSIGKSKQIEKTQAFNSIIQKTNNFDKKILQSLTQCNIRASSISTSKKYIS